LILAGTSLPDGLGVAAALEFRQRFPAIPVIVMAVNESFLEGKAALRAGASAYCGMYIGEDELVNIMRRATTLCDPPPPELPEPSDLRELEILRLIQQGKSHSEIAGELGISVQTVKNHVTSILRKLDRGGSIRASV
jgi:two-component system, NarL family, response regulator DegU